MCTILASFATGLDPCTTVATIAGHHPSTIACVDLASTLVPSTTAVDPGRPSSTIVVVGHRPGLATAFTADRLAIAASLVVVAAASGQHPHSIVVVRRSSLFQMRFTEGVERL